MKNSFRVTPKTKENPEPFSWCIIGNIVSSYLHGEEKQIKKGTKHFRAGTKVYCFPQYGGMGHERIDVIGPHRKSHRFIRIAIDTGWITNFRVKKVYKPSIMSAIQECTFYGRFKNPETVEEQLNQMISGLAFYCREIKNTNQP